MNLYIIIDDNTFVIKESLLTDNTQFAYKIVDLKNDSMTNSRVEGSKHLLSKPYFFDIYSKTQYKKCIKNYKKANNL